MQGNDKRKKDEDEFRRVEKHARKLSGRPRASGVRPIQLADPISKASSGVTAVPMNSARPFRALSVRQARPVPVPANASDRIWTELTAGIIASCLAYSRAASSSLSP